METPEMFVRRAAEFAEKAHHGQVRKYTGFPYITHPMEVVAWTCKFTDDPKVLAAAWLHDVVEDTTATLDEVAREFGVLVAGMVRSLSDLTPHEEGNRAYRKGKYATQLALASADTQLVKVADFLSNTESIVRNDWKFARVYLKEMADMLTLLDKAPPEILRMAVDQLKVSLDYLDQVVGNAPLNAPRLSTGDPATLGAYRMLSRQTFGEDSKAVSYLDDLISAATFGVGTVVPEDEGQVVALLTSMHDGTFEKETAEGM